MDLPTPPQAVAALAAFVRDRLAEVSSIGSAAIGSAATVIVGAAAPFAPTSYSRARLIRQMHASGLLTADEVRRAHAVLDYSPPADAVQHVVVEAAVPGSVVAQPRDSRVEPGAPR